MQLLRMNPVSDGIQAAQTLILPIYKPVEDATLKLVFTYNSRIILPSQSHVFRV